MSDELTPADMAEFKHRVPVGATIPADMEHAVVKSDQEIRILCWPHNMTVKTHSLPTWTREPLTPPRPPLPTEPGSVIVDVETKQGLKGAVAMRLMSFAPERVSWCVMQGGRLIDWVEDGDIVAFTPARVVPDEAGADR